MAKRYKPQEKHIELFKQIPCGNFGVSKLFFDWFKKQKIEDITFDDIFLAYYYISTEMMDSVDSKYFIVRKNINTLLPPYDCHDPLTEEQIPIDEFREQKLFNGIIHHYINRAPNRKYYGLVAIPKKNNVDIQPIFEDYKIFATNYKHEHFRHDVFTNERRYCLGDDELNHLYRLLKQLTDKADFQYIQPGSIILAQEMASVMINHNIILNNQHTTNGYEYVKQHKLFMFGEITHTYEKHY